MRTNEKSPEVELTFLTDRLRADGISSLRQWSVVRLFSHAACIGPKIPRMRELILEGLRKWRDGTSAFSVGACPRGSAWRQW